MIRKSLIVATASLSIAAALSLPAEAKTDSQIRGTVMFWLFDRNGDGAIDRSEVEALRAVVFDAVDADDDGKVTRKEVIEAIAQREELRQMRGERRGGSSHNRWNKGELTERRQERIMDRLGIDGENGLSKEAFVSAPPRLFERADENDDGSVSQAEFEQASRHIGRMLILE